MAVKWSELLEGFEFAGFDGGMGENQAYVCRETGQILWHSDLDDVFDELPDDIDDGEKYLAIPDKKELGLGKPLVLDFAAEHLPDDFDKVREIFSRSGAYARFKDLLERRRALESWYAFETAATEKALREWCEDNDLAIEG